MKYHSERITVDHKNFPSKLEAAVYNWLKLKVTNKEIENLQCQEKVLLTLARICYIADFSYFDIKREKKIYAEAKGFETAEWRIKKRLWQYYGPGLLEVYKGVHDNFKLSETLVPHTVNADTQNNYEN